MCDCHNKTVRKVVTCPTTPVETTILTELRNMYEFLVAKFLALFALPVLTQTDLAYTREEFVDVAALDGDTFDVPAKTLCIVFDVLLDNGTVDVIMPGSASANFSFHQSGVYHFPVSPKYHNAGEGSFLNNTANDATVIISYVSEE